MFSRRNLWMGVGLGLLAAVAGNALTPVSTGAAGVSAHDTSVTALPSAVPSDFWLATAAGPVEAFGVPDYGSPSGPLNQPVVATVTTPDAHGYWLVASDGGVF